MKAKLFPSVLLIACLATRAFAADGKTDAKQDAPKAVAPDDAKDPAAKPAPPPAAGTATAKSDKAGKSTDQKSSTAKDAAKASKEEATLLAPVEVKRNRLIEHDREILDLQADIERETKRTKSTETDQALNNEKVSSALSIFGGSSSKSREELAKERVSLMEAELNLLEMMDRVKTKAERDSLQTQANELRDMRRNLERGGPAGPNR